METWLQTMMLEQFIKLIIAYIQIQQLLVPKHLWQVTRNRELFVLENLMSYASGHMQEIAERSSQEKTVS